MDGEFDMAHPHNINYYAHDNNIEFQQHNRSSFFNKNTVVLENGHRYYKYPYLYKQYLKDLSSKSQPTSSTAATNRRLQQKQKRQSKFSMNSNTAADTVANDVQHLPRLKSWNIYENGLNFEGKQVMRTEAVRSFFIHYILTKEDSWQGIKQSYKMKPYEAALNHYRLPGHLTGSLYTGTLSYPECFLTFISIAVLYTLGKFTGPPFTGGRNNHFIHAAHYQQLSSTTNEHALNTKNDEYSYARGNYNGVDCKWPLTCDRRVFPYFCNNSETNRFDSVKWEAEHQLHEEKSRKKQSPNSKTQLKTKTKKVSNNIKPTPEAIVERIQLLKFQKTRIDISLILPYVEHNYKQRMMRYNNNRQRNNKRNSKNNL